MTLHLTYIQESGRCGRDEFLANSVLFSSKAAERITSPLMINYSQNSKVCHREMLFCDFYGFDTYKKPCSHCMYCNVCAQKCKCEFCTNSICLVPYPFTHNIVS